MVLSFFFFFCKVDKCTAPPAPGALRTGIGTLTILVSPKTLATVRIVVSQPPPAPAGATKSILPEGYLGAAIAVIDTAQVRESKSFLRFISSPKLIKKMSCDSANFIKTII